MPKSIDDNLNLEALLKRCRDLEPQQTIDLYYDPSVYLFFIQFKGVMPFWIPRGATYMCSCDAGQVHYALESFLAQAVIKLKQGIKT